MEDNTEQAVVEDQEVEAEPSTDGSNAQESADEELDTLLSQYDEALAASANPAPQQTAEPDTELLKRVQELEQSLAQTQSQGDLSKLVDRVRGDNEQLDPDFVEAWIDSKARKDPRMQKAWENRASNPKGLEKVADALGRELGQVFKAMPDAQVTEDMEAVTAAVKGASKKAPDAPDIDEKAVLSMNDAEFEEWCASQSTG